MNSESIGNKIIRWGFDNIEELISVSITGRILFVQFIMQKDQGFRELLLQVLIIVTLLAISSLRDRFYRFRQISDAVKRIDTELEVKVFDPIRAGNLFAPNKEISPAIYEDAEQILICGISLIRTVGQLHETIHDRVFKGAQVKIIVLDKDAPEAISQLMLRSWGPVAAGYYEKRIASTIGQIEVIAQNLNSSPGVKGSLEIGFLPFVPSFGLVIVNPTDILNSIARVKIFHHLTDNPSPKFFLTASQDPVWFAFFHEQFQKIWDLSKKVNYINNDTEEPVPEADKPKSAK